MTIPELKKTTKSMEYGVIQKQQGVNRGKEVGVEASSFWLSTVTFPVHFPSY
jgi:hypothetical protein